MKTKDLRREVMEAPELFRTPPSNVEQSAIEFVRHVIQPWAKRWEDALCRKGPSA